MDSWVGPWSAHTLEHAGIPPPSTAAERAERLDAYTLDDDAGDNLSDDGDNLALVTANEADLECEYAALHTPRPIVRPAWVRVGPRWVLDR